MFNPREEGTWYDAAGVKEKFGVPPEQVVDVMALMGDTIDNIKGVPGIGEKGAKELIGKYGSVENLIAHATELTPKRRETLLANVDAARQSRELATIHTGVPVEFEPERLRYGGFARERCFQIFSELGFTTLVKEFAPTADSVTKDYRVVNTAADLRALVDRLQAAGAFTFRVLVDRASAMQASIVGVAFSTKPRDADYVPVGHHALGAVPSMPLDEALDILGPLFANPSIVKSGHDLKFDAIVLGRHEVALEGSAPTRCWRAICWMRPATRISSRTSHSSTRRTEPSPKRTSAGRASRRFHWPTCLSRRRSTTRVSAPIWSDSSRRCLPAN